jgi:type II secretory pathway component PulK
MRSALKSAIRNPASESGSCLLWRSPQCAKQGGSVLVIVLWIAFGLVSLALYFANSMNFELHASDNRVSSMAADQAIDGAERYINYLLTTQIANGSNGVFPILSDFQCREVPVGDSHFWLIGRDTNSSVGPGRMCFGLVDEASKLNLNMAASNSLYTSDQFSNQIIWLPRMTADLTQAILDWVNTNGNGPTTTYYAMQQPAYQCKCDLFETVDELRLLYGADMDTLVGEDANRNGILDPNETDDNQNGMLDPGILEYFTVYSREPNTNGSGTAPINISSVSSGSGPLRSLLETNFGAARADQILDSLGVGSSGLGGPPKSPGTPGATGGGTGVGTGPATTTVTFASPLAFYRKSGMTSTEFALIGTNLTVASGTYILGRVNINTASAAVLACLVGGDTGVAQQLVNYRQSNPNNLTSIAWIIDALGQNYPDALTALEGGDYITTQSYQYTADIAALGPYGRGYRRVKFIFDTCDGTPKIIYRQDLTHLGWALGKEVRQNLLLAKETR